PSNRREDLFEADAGVFEDFFGFLAGLGDSGDVEGFELDVVIAPGDGGGDFGVEAAGVVILDRDDSPAGAGGEVEDSVGFQRKGIGVDDGGFFALFGELVGGLEAFVDHVAGGNEDEVF